MANLRHQICHLSSGIPKKILYDLRILWLVEYKSRPVVLETDIRSRKRMFIIFFHTQGCVIVDVMKKKLQSLACILHNLSFPKCSPRYSVNTSDSKMVTRIELIHDNATSRTHLYHNGIRLNEHPLSLTRLLSIFGCRNELYHWWDAFFKDPRAP